jgi:arylformamidase
MRQLDISMPLFAGMPAFPGDPLFRSEKVRAIVRGDAYDISRLSFGSHAGTHIDPPVHFVPDGPSLDQIDLEALNGPCQVVGVSESIRTVGDREVGGVSPGTRRVLFRTANSERWRRRLEFFSDYVGLDPSAAEALVDRGVRLVGIDSLSVERDSTGRFPVHHRLLGAGVLILEGLLLAEATPGNYELRCFPLRVREGDGGPARAVLLAP